MLKKLIYLFFTVVMFTACGDDPIDPCAGIDCSANGVCVDGTCDCEDGYSGDNCEVFHPCFSVDCGDNGTCIDGACDCKEGFYGDNCENLIQDLFRGTWNGTDCDGDDYTITVIAGATPTDLIVLSTGLVITAMIESENKFVIPTQTLVEPIFQIEVVVSGDGTLLDDGTLSFAATVSSALGGGSCTSVLTAQ